MYHIFFEVLKIQQEKQSSLSLVKLFSPLEESDFKKLTMVFVYGLEHLKSYEAFISFSCIYFGNCSYAFFVRSTKLIFSEQSY